MKFKENIDFYFTLFRNYVSSFYCNDININRNIKIKEDHTFRVVQNIRKLVRSNSIEEEISTLSILSALFHDIGRFNQFKIYGTFDDKTSIDHAELGVNILREMKVLDKLPSRDKELILESIFYHNKKGIHLKCNDPQLIQLTDLLREADKKDLLKLHNDGIPNE